MPSRTRAGEGEPADGDACNIDQDYQGWPLRPCQPRNCDDEECDQAQPGPEQVRRRSQVIEDARDY